jgi:hypothetical protein
MSDARTRSRGAASVEYLALAGMIGLLIVVASAALVASPPTRGDRELGQMLARRIACPPRYPVPCGRNPLALAYGFPLGKLVRYLAPAQAAIAGELPVDFRYCRHASCAAPSSDRGLTVSGRRVTEFVSVEDARSAGGPVRVTYWFYRPGLGWQRIVRTAWAAEIARASSIRLNLEDDPALVPLETLPGRDHYLFPPGEEPPWRKVDRLTAWRSPPSVGAVMRDSRFAWKAAVVREILHAQCRKRTSRSCEPVLDAGVHLFLPTVGPRLARIDFRRPARVRRR